MKILFVINSLDTGGAPKLVADLACRLSEDGNIVGVLIYEKRETENLYRRIAEHPGITLYELTKGHPLSVANLLRTRRICREYDVVHAHLFPSGYAVRLANMYSKIPILYTEHSTHNRRRNHVWLRPLERFIYSGYNGVATVSDLTKEALDRWLGTKKLSEKTEVVTNGVDVKAYSRKIPAKSSEELFGREGIPILMMARFTDAKDHATAIKSLLHIDNPDVFLAFAGQGETLEEMKRLARDLGLAERVKFLGMRTDTAALMASASIGLQASKWEGLCLTAVEIMASGLPLVASRVPGLMDVVEDAALMYEAGDETGLASQINRLLSDEDLCTELKTAGVKRAEQFDIGVTASNYMKRYEKIISTSN